MTSIYEDLLCATVFTYMVLTYQQLTPWDSYYSHCTRKEAKAQGIRELTLGRTASKQQDLDLNPGSRTSVAVKSHGRSRFLYISLFFSSFSPGKKSGCTGRLALLLLSSFSLLPPFTTPPPRAGFSC